MENHDDRIKRLEEEIHELALKNQKLELALETKEKEIKLEKKDVPERKAIHGLLTHGNRFLKLQNWELVLILCIAVAAISAYWILNIPGQQQVILNATLQNVSVQGTLPQPVPLNETITNNPDFAGINMPLTQTEIRVFQNPNLNYYNIAAAMILNGTVPVCSSQQPDNCIASPVNNLALLTANDKPSVIYLGSTTCIYCGENRWAMALALATFGNFSKLFIGYSALGDSHISTIYWSQDELYSAAVDLGNYYNSSYINFVSIEDTDPILQYFSVQPLSQIGSAVTNSVYSAAFNFLVNNMNTYVIKNSQNGIFQTSSGPVNIVDLSTLQRASVVFGTPQTVWGKFYFPGASSVAFYDGTIFINDTTQAQIISNISTPHNQFAWTEYAGADMYIAALCASITNKPPVCSKPAIAELTTKI